MNHQGTCARSGMHVISRHPPLHPRDHAIAAECPIGEHMPLASWLFLKDAETIWVERPYGTTLIVAGPGKGARQERNFRDEADLDRFQMDLAQRLATDGW